MKSGVAAMLTAVNRFIQQHAQHAGSIAFLITSDEEGKATHGTVKIVERLEERNEKIDWCIVGEPSSVAQVGDMIKNGRRGSLSFKLTVIGKQGHIAYPQLANNPIHLCAPAITELTNITWDQGAPYFQPTSFQISNLNAGTGATNVIPGTVEILGNFRYSPALTVDALKDKVLTVLKKHHLEFNIEWTHGAQPFLTAEGKLFEACRSAIEDVTGLTTKLSTDGGTSDGRFIAPTGAQVIELGVCNNTIHQINECARVDDIEKLSKIYERILERLFI
jgi:succinyl-diaminopimelate desuccinylase